MRPPPGAPRLPAATARLAAAGPQVVRREAPPAPPRSSLDVTISERAPATSLPGWAAACQLVRLVDGFPLSRHVFSHGIVRIGRAEDCDLRLDDPLVSRCHALIERQPGDRYVLHDQLSANGVQVNGERVARARLLHDGDVLLLGSTRLMFHAPLALAAGADDAEATLGFDDAGLDDPFIPITPPSGTAGPVRAGGAVGGGPPDVERAPTGQGPDAPGRPPPPRRPGPRPRAPPSSRRSATRPEPGAGGADRARSARERRAAELFALAAQAPSSDDGAPVAPAAAESGDDQAQALGHTLVLAPRRVQEDQREGGVAVRALLRETVPGRWSGSHAAPPGADHVIARDAFLIGAGEDVDLRLQGKLMPRVVAMIVRGLDGFSITQVAGWPWTTKVEGRAVADRSWLEDGDVVVVAGQTFTFHVAAAP
ncbi:MAG: FHA domain-containing protein [Planctomycetes bacterium]|nr:FHA domain-containing protein [Planctomycetota bacterium]